MLSQDLGWVSGHVEDELIRPLLQHLTTRSHAITLRHHHIDHQEVDPAMRKAQHIEGFCTRVRFEDTEALLGEDSVSDPAGNSFVVYDQDGRCGRQKWGQRQPLGVTKPCPDLSYSVCRLRAIGRAR